MRQNKAGQEDIKSVNKKLVFRTIVSEAPISRAEIKRKTKLAATTVSTLVDEFIAQGFLNETGLTQTNSVGRKATMLTVNNDGGYFLVLDVHKDRIYSRVYGLSLTQCTFEKVCYSSEKELYPLIVRIIEDTLKLYPKLLSAVIALPALLHNTNRNAASSVLGFSVDTGALQSIQSQFEGLTIEFCNTSGLAAFAQKTRYPEIRNLISVDVFDGVGSGVIIDGDIYQGKNGLAGEFGHICMDIHGERCLCGGRGCLEQYISIPVILERISRRLGKKVTLQEAVELFKNNDDAAVEVLTSVARRFSLALNTIINLFDPELVIISGEICDFGENFYNMVTERLHNLSLIGRDRPVRFMHTDESLASIGGANYLFNRYLDK